MNIETTSKQPLRLSTTETTPSTLEKPSSTAIMPPKKNAAAQQQSAPPKLPQTTNTPSTAASTPQPIRKAAASAKATSNETQDIFLGVWNKYVSQTPQRTKLLDTFMGFLIVVGVLQFVYCVIAGNYVRQISWQTERDRERRRDQGQRADKM